MPYCDLLVCWKYAVALIRRASAIASIWLAAFTVSAFADFTFPNFSDTTGLTLVGSAEVIEQRLRLTPDIGEQAGAAWFITKQSVADGFATTFQVQIGVDGADGFAFVIQNHDITAPGSCCGGQGYEFIPNSLAVEFDTWQNIPEDFPSGLGDPNENHISVQTRGVLPNSADPLFSLGFTTAIPYLSDGQPHTVKITYTPGTLRIFVDDLVTPALVMVVIDGCDSEVTNTVFPSGCTLADLLADCADDARKHRKFFHCVARLTRTMKRISIITGQQKDAIRSCAVQADLP
jgi:lectin family protein